MAYAVPARIVPNAATLVAVGWGALRGALVTVVAVAGIAAVPAPAPAVSGGRPTAIAVADDGTSYVGFADAASLLVLSPSGAPVRTITLRGIGPVTALAVAPDGSVWVDDGSTVTRLSPAGAVLAGFPHRPGASCAADPGRYGGLDVTASRVYVAERCRGTVSVYTRAGSLRATVDLPGTGLPRGVAWAPAAEIRHGGKVPARIYVAVPDAAKVYGYDVATLERRSKPAVTINLAYQRPGGLAADDRGHLAVLDAATNGLYLLDARHRYRTYRTLGHPTTPSSLKGYLDRPAAIAQGGARVGRHYWVADTGNGRVQRWNPSGTTQWMADAAPPSAPGTPVSTGAPAITGSPVVGAELACDDGAWSGEPTSYAHGWWRDGVALDGATTPTYVVTAADAGTRLSCVVTATNAAGTGTPATSPPVAVPGGEPEPEPAPVTTCRGTPSVTIVGGDRVAHDPYVQLTIRAPEGAREVVISNDGFRHADRKSLVESCTYAWTLSGGAARRPKVVSVRFPGVPGVVRDRVVLDGTAPVIRRVTARWVNARQGWVLKIRARDRGTGIDTVKVGKTRSGARTWRWPADIVSWDSTQLRWIQVTDRAGNESRWYRLRL